MNCIWCDYATPTPYLIGGSVEKFQLKLRAMQQNMLDHVRRTHPENYLLLLEAMKRKGWKEQK